MFSVWVFWVGRGCWVSSFLLSCQTGAPGKDCTAQINSHVSKLYCSGVTAVVHLGSLTSFYKVWQCWDTVTPVQLCHEPQEKQGRNERQQHEPFPTALVCSALPNQELLQWRSNLSCFIQLNLFAYLRLIFFPVILAAKAHQDIRWYTEWKITCLCMPVTEVNHNKRYDKLCDSFSKLNPVMFMQSIRILMPLMQQACFYLHRWVKHCPGITQSKVCKF